MSRKWSDETKKAQGLHKRDRALLRELGDVANAEGKSWYRQETLAANMGWSERTVRTALKNLEQMGWIVRTRDWHRGGKRKGERKSDLIQLRTLAEAGAWAMANVPADPTEEHGGGDGPGPGSRITPPAVRRLETVAAFGRQPVNTPTRQQSPARQAAAVRRARAAAAHQVDPEVEGERLAAEAAAAGPGDIHDLAARLKAAGHEVPAVAGDDPPARRAAG